MKDNIFVEFLMASGWEQEDDMSYKLNTFQILFDTSNQIEFYNKKKKLGEGYLTSINDLKQFLKATDLEVTNFTIATTAATTRLSDYLEEHLWSFIPSRKGIKKAIKRQQILVNQQPSTTGYRLKEGDVVAYVLESVAVNSIQLPIDVLYEDAHFAVVVKPSGIPTSGNQARTLKNTLTFNLQPSGENNALPHPLPVHRLDALTSGLLLIAKTTTASIHLSRQFQLRQVQKEYSAVVSGDFPQQLQQINTPLDGKPAVTRLSIVEQAPSLKAGQLTLLQVFPETGRTHQIRRHLASVGCPILGDPLYAKDHKTLKGKGLFLCAVGLEFLHPITNEKVVYRMNPPAKFLRRLVYEKGWYERFR